MRTFATFAALAAAALVIVSTAVAGQTRHRRLAACRARRPLAARLR